MAHLMVSGETWPTEQHCVGHARRRGEDSLPQPIVRSGEYFLPGRALHELYEGDTGAFLGVPGASQRCAEDGHRGGFS
ncbi:jg14369 [Pararge aegeria aegeria]|uniref:Jg14369 protein n=1 Tax=Pararge aegeria aegeria TaxID=348720 RepID=A0A8S4SA68_9NEOP|nr:jg14369 [Pararge aegeria aegeria]